jgi:quercetin dioxygenase-like cupin family protein
MKRRTLAVALLSALTLAAAKPKSVPIQDEPMHHVKLANDWVRVFDVLVPPHEKTLFHLHAHDYVFVTLGDARIRSEKADGAATELVLKDGEARYTPAPLVHRAVNLAATPFRNITVEILGTPGVSPEPPMPAMPGHSVAYENERIRIDRQVLEPGQSTGVHTHTLMSLGVVVSPARVEYSEEGAKPEVFDLAAGEFSWHGKPRTHSLKNVGTTRFEAVEIELK